MNDALILRCRRYRNKQRRPGERPDMDGMETALQKISEHTTEAMTWMAWMENLIKVQLSKKHSTRSHNELETFN